MDTVTSTYEHKLQAAYTRIQKRGIMVDTDKLQELRLYIDTELEATVKVLSNLWHEKLSLGKVKGSINLRSPAQLKDLLKAKGFKLPSIPPTKAQRDSGNSDYKESVSKLPLQLLLAKTGDHAIKKLLTIAELMTLKSRYINAELYDTPAGESLYLSSYNVAGTLTGRRSSNKNIFGYGGNAQNFPKHTKSAERFLSCLVPRKDHVFLLVDQKSAEEWPVSALCRNMEALTELRNGVDRHTNLAAFVFGKPVNTIEKKGIERYLGKKSRHANNYGMQAKRMSLSLAQEGFFISERECSVLLDKVNSYDPSVRHVYHQYIRHEISTKRFLRTPFGRERYFGGFRPNSSNNDVFGEAFAYIPQSVVGDNTGFSILYLESNKIQNDFECQVVQEGHDSIVQDVLYDVDTLWLALQNTMRAFKRDVVFDKDFTFEIPVEAEIGFNFNDTVALHEMTRDGIITSLEKLEKKKISVSA